MAREIGAWLSGPQSLSSSEGYPGQLLGLPERGPGSLARPGRRAIGLLVDWLMYHQIAAAMKEAAKQVGVPIEWGGDWKMKDGPHWQLPWKDYP